MHAPRSTVGMIASLAILNPAAEQFPKKCQGDYNIAVNAFLVDEDAVILLALQYRAQFFHTGNR